MFLLLHFSSFLLKICYVATFLPVTTYNFKSISKHLSFEFPAWGFSLIASGILFVVLFTKYRSRSYTPEPETVFLLLSILGSMGWINLIIGLIIDVLELVQTITGLPSLLLGMTIMAVGNSCTGTSEL